MTRLVGHTTTQWSRLTGKRMPPHQFALTGGVTEWIGLDVNSVPNGRAI